jgi:uncharacterized SAM-dependent methyltransferase
VTIAGADRTIDFPKGESIWTGSSYKFNEGSIAAFVSRTGFRQARQWIEGEARFALTLFEAV